MTYLDYLEYDKVLKNNLSHLTKCHQKPISKGFCTILVFTSVIIIKSRFASNAYITLHFFMNP